MQLILPWNLITVFSSLLSCNSNKMADTDCSNGNGNGVYEEEEEEAAKSKQRNGKVNHTLPEVLNRIASSILFPDPCEAGSLLRRIKVSVADNAPLLPEASRNSASHVLIWTRRGTPFRALFVISVGTVTFVALSGLFVFILFFLAVTINAIFISLLMSLAAAGGFLALFFAFVTAIYIGALSIAIFAISVTTFWAIVATLIITGWIGLIYTVWLLTRKSFGFAKHSLEVAGSAISSYTTACHGRYLIHTNTK